MSQVGHTFVTVRRPLRAYIGSLPHRPPETRPGRPEPPGSRRGNPPEKTAAGEPARRNRPGRTHPGNQPRGTCPPEPTRGNLPRKTYRRKPTPANRPEGTTPPGHTAGNRSAGTSPRAHPAGGTDPPPPASGTPGRGWSDPLVCLAGTAPKSILKVRHIPGGGLSNQQLAENCKKSFGGYLAKAALKNLKGRRKF